MMAQVVVHKGGYECVRVVVAVLHTMHMSVDMTPAMNRYSHPFCVLRQPIQARLCQPKLLVWPHNVLQVQVTHEGMCGKH